MAPPTPEMALISLEDLEGLDDEQLDDAIGDNPEPTGGDDQLLSHWRAVASTHQVSVPSGVSERARGRARARVDAPWAPVCVPEMSGPIHEMTRNSQQREQLPFVLLSRHEKVGVALGGRWARPRGPGEVTPVWVQVGEVLYEERLYPAGFWASVRSAEELYEQSISVAFMRLMRFICQENSAGQPGPAHRAPPRLTLVWMACRSLPGHDGSGGQSHPGEGRRRRRLRRGRLLPEGGGDGVLPARPVPGRPAAARGP